MLNNNKIYKLAFIGDFGRSDVVAMNVLLSDGDGNSQLFRVTERGLGWLGRVTSPRTSQGAGPRTPASGMLKGHRELPPKLGNVRHLRS